MLSEHEESHVKKHNISAIVVENGKAGEKSEHIDEVKDDGWQVVKKKV